MARQGCQALDTGDAFPSLEMDSVGGERIVLPELFSGKWNVLFFYRGHW